MAILPSSLDYTDRDFDALKARLEKGIRTVFPDWSDFDVATFGNLLLESNAFTGDVHTYYQNRQAREAFWAVANLRKSLLDLGKLIGFEPSTATASQVDVTISIKDGGVAVNDVPIVQGSVVRTRDVNVPIRFRTLADTLIPAGFSEVVGVTAENSEQRSETFESTGLPNQEIQLASTPFLENGLLISDSAGPFSIVDSFLDSTAADRHATVAVNELERATVRFGNGTAGAIPIGTITSSYNVGGGSSGRVDPGTVSRIDGTFTDALSNPVQLEVTNPAASTPAVDRPTIEQIRIEGPETLRALNRTVAREDFEINARRVAGVSRSLMLTSDQDSGLPENSGILFVVPEGGGAATQAILDAVLAEVTTVRPRTVTFQVTTQSAVYLQADVTTTVYLKSGFETAAAKATARATILADLASFFAISNEDGTPNTKIDFGFNLKDADGNPSGEITWSDVHNSVRDSSPVRKVDAGATGFLLNGARDDLTIALREFPILGDVVIINGDTGAPL
jgi:hypothetical protein